MKGINKLLALILVLSMSVCVFSGCAGTFYLLNAYNKAIPETEEEVIKKIEIEEIEPKEIEPEEVKPEETKPQKTDGVTKEELVGTWYIIGDVAEENNTYLIDYYDEVTTKAVFKDDGAMEVHWAEDGGYEAVYYIDGNILTYNVYGNTASYYVVPYEGNLLFFEIVDGVRTNEGFIQTKNTDGIDLSVFEEG